MTLLAAELRKLWTTRVTWIVSGLGLLLIGLTAGTTLFSRQLGPPFTGADAQVAEAVNQVGANSLIVLVVALIAMTTEFRHGTIGRTLQLTPSRLRALGAKLAGGAVYAVVFFAAGLLVVGVLVGVAVLTEGVAVSPGPETLRALWQGPIGLVLNALFGVAVGALIRSQALALTLVLIWLLVVENLVTALWSHIGRWLPFQALSALFLPGEVLAAAPEGLGPLTPPVALAVFLGYVAVAVGLSAVLLRVRDVGGDT